MNGTMKKASTQKIDVPSRFLSFEEMIAVNHLHKSILDYGRTQGYGYAFCDNTGREYSLCVYHDLTYGPADDAVMLTLLKNDYEAFVAKEKSQS